MKLFGVVFPFQKAQISALCWGERCGKGQLGAIQVDEGVQAIPCREQSCPYSVKEMEDPIGEVSGESLYLRKLMEVERDRS